MSAIAESVGRRDSRSSALFSDLALMTGGSLTVAALAQLYVKLPFTPVPVTGQTLAVLIVGAGLGGLRAGGALLLYLGWIALGLPFGAEGQGGAELLGLTSATGGYLWGFVVAAAVVGRLAELGWDRKLRSALGAMLLGEIIIFTSGVTWLASALDVPVTQALEPGLYPFLLGDMAKLLIASALLPAIWKLRPGPRRLRVERLASRAADGRGSMPTSIVGEVGSQD